MNLLLFIKERNEKKMTMKKKILTTLSVVLILGMAALGILAYLTSEDSDVNVMTLGNVQIDQHEYERVVENGAYKVEDGSYVLKDFSQAKPLYPATDIDANGDPYNYGAGDYDSTRVKMSQVDSHGSMDVFVNKNAQDKFVTVENTGKSDAYVRTIIAMEIGSLPTAEFDNVIRTSSFMTDQGVWKVTDIGSVEIDGNNYFVAEYIYNGAKDLGGVHENGVLPAGDTTYPSLAQVYMTAAATNEDCEALDGNKNGTYDILVYSQAGQVKGFESVGAEKALDTMFYDVTTTMHPWAEGVEIPEVISTPKDLVKAAKNGGSFVLDSDITFTDKSEFYYGNYVCCVMKDTTIDLNGHNITVDVNHGQNVENAPVLFYVYLEGAKLTIVGEGDVVSKYDAFLFFPRGVSDGLDIYGGNYYNIDDTSGTKNDINAIVYSQTNNKINIYGGTYTFKNVNGHCGGFNIYDNAGAEIVLHEGVLLSNSNYYKGSDADEIHLAEGCTLEEVVIDGVTWYKVVKK